MPTEVLGAFCDHLAVYLPKTISRFDDLESIREDLILVLCRDILSSAVC